MTMGWMVWGGISWSQVSVLLFSGVLLLLLVISITTGSITITCTTTYV